MSEEIVDDKELAGIVTADIHKKIVDVLFDKFAMRHHPDTDAYYRTFEIQIPRELTVSTSIAPTVGALRAWKHEITKRIDDTIIELLEATD